MICSSFCCFDISNVRMFLKYQRKNNFFIKKNKSFTAFFYRFFSLKNRCFFDVFFGVLLF